MHPKTVFKKGDIVTFENNPDGEEIQREGFVLGKIIEDQKEQNNEFELIRLIVLVSDTTQEYFKPYFRVGGPPKSWCAKRFKLVLRQQIT